MRRRYLLLSLFGFFLMTNYMNCSNYSDSLNDGTDLSSSEQNITTYQGIRVLNGTTEMKCYDDHIDVGGSCNTADATDNYIQYSIKRNRNPVYWGTGASATDHLTLAKCQNGRFFAIIPKPNDPSAIGVTTKGTVEYQLHFQMFTTVPGKTGYQAGEVGNIFTFAIQTDGNCS